MDEDLMAKLENYAKRRDGRLSRWLGSGIHGIVHTLESNTFPGVSAVKIHRESAAYERERDAYLRLWELGIAVIPPCRVPQLIAADDELLVVEMTMVKPPFALDFGSAWLDWPPHFSEEIWEERRAKWSEEFGADWPTAQAILAALEELGIYMLDPSPNNIRFR